MSEETNKIALVTGAARGIGHAVARALGLNGATVIATDADITPLETNADLGPHAVVLKLDVTSEADWQAAATEVERRFGRLDALINNAGVILNRPFLKTSLTDLQRVNRINVEGVWIGMQTLFPLLARAGKRDGGASIVNMSSIYGLVAGPMHAAYCASKGAVHLLSKAVAVEFARMGSGIRVNSVHPGPVNTDLGRSGFQDAVDLGLVRTIEEAKALTVAQHPVGRMAEVDDIVGAILFLLSDQARFMTGTELVVDAGYTAR